MWNELKNKKIVMLSVLRQSMYELLAHLCHIAPRQHTRLLAEMLKRRASAENFPGGGQRKKRPKISKKYRKIALFASSRVEGDQRKKRPKNSTF